MFHSLFLAAALASAERCPDVVTERLAWFGDTHIHTGWSLDASTRMGTRTTPDDAYRFARGGKIALQPYDEAGNAQRSLKNNRPLDFAAITDHAESYRIVRICNDADNPGFDSWICRNFGPATGILAPLLARWADRLGLDGVDYCGPDGSYCDAAYRAVWQDTIDSAARFNSPCEFTSFNGYEWSGGSGGSNMHRNVIFASDVVPEAPISALEEAQVEGLWIQLDMQCREEEGCAAITIPHNMNLSRGDMFSRNMSNGEPMTALVAEQRQRYERLAEIMQHKGDSECFFAAGVTEDELCNFEKLSYETFIAKYAPFIGGSPKNDTRYMREALREGLRIEADLGINPFMPGFIASTDTHIGAAGGVQESDHGGHHGDQVIVDSLPYDQQITDKPENSPGGLAVVYAEQNTRDSLFSAMRRREAYGTSGPRIGVRFFGGQQFPDNSCQANDLVEQGYAHGVPMGGELALNNAPEFLVSATQDPQGTPLQRLQIIKGWVDGEGKSMEAVHDVAGGANDASVNLDACAPVGKGAAAMCAQWRDPDYEPGQKAWYYARVVENPSCRWLTWQCLNAGVDCSDAASVPDALEPCCSDEWPKTIQERAWTSPIWVGPAD